MGRRLLNGRLLWNCQWRQYGLRQGEHPPRHRELLGYRFSRIVQQLDREPHPDKPGADRWKQFQLVARLSGHQLPGEWPVHAPRPRFRQQERRNQQRHRERYVHDSGATDDELVCLQCKWKLRRDGRSIRNALSWWFGDRGEDGQFLAQRWKLRRYSHDKLVWRRHIEQRQPRVDRRRNLRDRGGCFVWRRQLVLGE